MPSKGRPGRTTDHRRRHALNVPRVYLPVDPLRIHLEDRFGVGATHNRGRGYHGAMAAGFDSRQWTRYLDRGVPLSSADKIAVRLGVHPAEIWGQEWFAA